MATVSNINLGPSTVTFSGTLGGISYDALDLGAFNEEGVTVTVTTDGIDVATDQTGTAPARVFLGGQSATVTTPMLEETFDLTYLALVGAVSGTGNRIDFGRKAGYDIAENWAGQLEIKPIDATRDKFVLHSCIPTGEVSAVYNSTDPYLLQVEWRALPDTTLADGKQLGFRSSQ